MEELLDWVGGGCYYDAFMFMHRYVDGKHWGIIRLDKVICQTVACHCTQVVILFGVTPTWCGVLLCREFLRECWKYLPQLNPKSFSVACHLLRVRLDLYFVSIHLMQYTEYPKATEGARFGFVRLQYSNIAATQWYNNCIVGNTTVLLFHRKWRCLTH